MGGSKKKTFITGEHNNFGGGIVIKNTISKSEFQNTEFKFLSGVEKRFSRDINLNKDHLLLTKYDISKKNSYIHRKSNFKEKNFIFSNDFLYTGAINFYNTNLTLKNCSFSKIDSGRCSKCSFFKLRT